MPKTFHVNSTDTGFNYVVQSETNLTDATWQTQPGDDTVQTFNISLTGTPQQVYRILVR